MTVETLYRTKEDAPPYDFVPVTRTGDHVIPEEYRNRILIHTVHDGDLIPASFIYHEDGSVRVPLDKLERRFIQERDWGANLVARKIAEAMGIKGYGCARVARVLCDFNRFPGSTPRDERERPLERLAINNPFSSRLDHANKIRLLCDYYDPISDYFEDNLLEDKLIMIAIHTYDEQGMNKARRSHLSLLSTVLGYQRESRLPYGVFDPMYPDNLAQATCSRILRDRISLNLERCGFRVSHNHPYPLPEGSMEVRAQVWYFFEYLRRRFGDAHPETKHDPSYELVWMMLLNTNMRLAEAEALRSWLHRYRRLPSDQTTMFHGARVAYERIGKFVEENKIVDEFRRSRDRPSSLGLEVRKDLVCSFDPETGRPIPATPDQEAQATLIGNVIANAITIYFETDIHFL